MKQLTLIILLSLIVFLVAYVSLNFSTLQKNYLYLKNNFSQSPTPSTPVTPQPRQIILPSGPETYNFSHGPDVKGPRVSSITYSPLTITPNSTQELIAKFPNTENLKEVSFTFETDHLSKQKVVLKQSATSPDTWIGSWTPTDTAATKYRILLRFVGDSGIYQEVMTIL